MPLQNTLLLLVVSIVLCGCAPSDVEKAQSAIRATLTDPSSAQFRNLVQYNGSIVCGEFNSKNSQGGYNDFKSFAFTDAGVVGDSNMAFGLCKNSDKTLSKEERTSEAASYLNAKAVEVAAIKLQIAEAQVKREEQRAAVAAEIEKLRVELNKIVVGRAQARFEMTIANSLSGVAGISERERIALKEVDYKYAVIRIGARIDALKRSIEN